jgi:hypothetical protein
VNPLFWLTRFPSIQTTPLQSLPSRDGIFKSPFSKYPGAPDFNSTQGLGIDIHPFSTFAQLLRNIFGGKDVHKSATAL